MARSTISWTTVGTPGATFYVPWTDYDKAGFTFDKMLHNTPDDAFDIIQKVHVRAPFRLIRQAAPYFRVKVLCLLFPIQIITFIYRVKPPKTARLSMYHPPRVSTAMLAKPIMPLLNHPSSVSLKPLLRNGVPLASAPTQSLSVSFTPAWQLRKKLEKQLISMERRLCWVFRVLRDLLEVLRNRTRTLILWFLSEGVDRRMKLLLLFFCECVDYALTGIRMVLIELNLMQPCFSSRIVCFRAHARGNRWCRHLNNGGHELWHYWSQLTSAAKKSVWVYHLFSEAKKTNTIQESFQSSTGVKMSPGWTNHWFSPVTIESFSTSSDHREPLDSPRSVGQNSQIW